jgi:hypothetical protein
LVSAVSKGRAKSVHGVFGDVLVEGTRLGASHQDALDRFVLESTVEGSVTKCYIQVTGVVALAQQQY